MKKLCCSLGLVALLAAGSPAFAKEAASVAASPSAIERVMALGKLPALPDSGMEEELSLQSLGESHGILSTLPMPKGAALSVCHVPLETLSDASGVLTMKGKKYTATAIAFGVELTGREAEEAFGGMFVPGGFTQEAGKKMLHFNMSLLKVENLANELFLNVAKGTREATGQRIPYDFFSMDMVKVEQLHRVMDHPKTYSFALRPYMAVDGFAVPLYMRGFATKSEKGYRFLLFVTLDSFRERLDETTYRIIHKK